MTFERYYEILKKHRIRRSRMPTDEELASMTEESVEDFCVKMKKLFAASFSEKHAKKFMPQPDGVRKESMTIDNIRRF